MIPALLSPRVIQYSAPLPTPTDPHVQLPESLAGAVAKRQTEFLGGRYCARQALLQAGWDSRLPFEIGVAEDRAPVWPAGWTGSITHSQGLASAAVARLREVGGIGIDSEELMSESAATGIRDRILTAAESESRLRREHLECNEAEFVTLIFSAKESIYKCLRPLAGQYFDFQAATVLKFDVAAGIFEFKLNKDIGPMFASGWTGEGRFKFAPGWVHTAMELATF